MKGYCDGCGKVIDEVEIIRCPECEKIIGEFCCYIVKDKMCRACFNKKKGDADPKEKCRDTHCGSYSKCDKIHCHQFHEYTEEGVLLK